MAEKAAETVESKAESGGTQVYAAVEKLVKAKLEWTLGARPTI